MPELVLYNTRSKQIETFRPLDPKKVTIYSCGPTVYDHAHIGNLSAYIFADTLRRTLKLAGYSVQHVMNITDVDDKTIARSLAHTADTDPIRALGDLTGHYERLFLADIEQIGFDTAAMRFVRATEHISTMQSLIHDLFTGGFAYITDDGVYFSIEAYKKAGHTYGQLIAVTAESTSHARISNDEYDKDDVHDFALWKLQKDGEPAWEFELDGHVLLGRPGWHIECSAMSKATVGQPFDIHTGGVDNIFPHHENEIAQSTATGPDLYANFFVHSEHLLVDGKKMAKSAQNFFRLADITEKGADPLAFRLLVLQSHYRSQTDFSWDSLEAAGNRLANLRAIADLALQQPATQGISKDIIDAAKADIYAALLNDLNTPRALAAVSTFESAVTTNGVSQNAREDYIRFLAWLDDALGLQLSTRSDITDEQKQLLHERQDARHNHDWTKADKIRKDLESQGIVLRDTPNGQVWSRLS